MNQPFYLFLNVLYKFQKKSVNKKCLKLSLFGKTQRSLGSVDCYEKFDKLNIKSVHLHDSHSRRDKRLAKPVKNKIYFTNSKKYTNKSYSKSKFRIAKLEKKVYKIFYKSNILITFVLLPYYFDIQLFVAVLVNVHIS